MYSEFQSLNNQFSRFKNIYNNGSSIINEFSSYIKSINLTQGQIFEKIENIHFHTGDRRRRGVFNGLGYIIKGITGNLDNDDGEKINKLLNHIQNNEENLTNQLKMQYSLNTNLIRSFNDTVKNIQHNENVLQSRIMQLNQMVREGIENTNILFAKDLLNQLVILYNNILNVFQDIENSITFCKLNTLHPSIITSKQLFDEIKKLSNHYKDQFTFEVRYENIFDFENIIKINCKIEVNRIAYFLSVPIDFEVEFNLYHLLPIPTKYESGFVSIIPDTQYVLKAENLIKPLSDMCTQTKPYHCSEYIVTNTNTACEEAILVREKSENCSLTKLTISENHMEIVPALNQYLAVFPQPEKIQIICDNRRESMELKGVLLIENHPCEVVFRGNKLNFLEKSYGRPIIFSVPELELQKQNVSKLSIPLRKLNLENFPIFSFPEIRHSENLYVPSLWTVTLYIILTAVLIYFSTIFFKKWLEKTRAKINRTTNTPEELTRTLPGEASF